MAVAAADLAPFLLVSHQTPSEARVKIGVFIPIGNNGWLISENSPQYWPSFALNKQITLTAERFGLDFVLSMIKLRGFGGKTEFWNHNLESFTLMAGLAAVTSRIKLFATCPTLAIPPAIAARMCSTIDSISNGRFGLNLITGWQKPEYSQMGLWPGDEYFGRRYQYVSEYIQIMRQLWETGRSDFHGEFFQMDDCRLSPPPQRADADHLRRTKRGWYGILGPICRLQFLLWRGRQHPRRFRPHRGQAEQGNSQDRAHRHRICVVHDHCR